MGNGGQHAVKWVNGESIPTDLGTLGGTDSFAIAVNGDGSVIVGFSKMTGDKAEHAVEWRDGATSPTDLGALGGTKSSAVDVSAAGAVIVGESETPSEIGVSSHAVKWANGAKVPTDLGILRSINPLVNLVASSHASAVSADGSVIVGYASFSDEDPGWLIVNRAVSWADGATNPTDLGIV